MSIQNAIRGKNNRAAGKAFEEIIEAACETYLRQGIADISKTPEPMKILQSIGNGRFIATFEKKAQPDFKGTLQGGTSVLFDAKTTATDKFSQNIVSDTQERYLDTHASLGGKCFIVLSHDFKSFYTVPWGVWREMKSIYGRKYITPEDVGQYRVVFHNGILDFLRAFH